MLAACLVATIPNCNAQVLALVPHPLAVVVRLQFLPNVTQPDPATPAGTPQKENTYQATFDDFDKWRVAESKLATRKMTALRRDGFPPVPRGGVVSFGPDIDSGAPPLLQV